MKQIIPQPGFSCGIRSAPQFPRREYGNAMTWKKLNLYRPGSPSIFPKELWWNLPSVKPCNMTVSLHGSIYR